MSYKSKSIFGLIVLSLMIITFHSCSQDGPRKSLRASVNQTISTDTDITIVYGRPGVKGRTIWGDLEEYGKVWRAGADENTTIEFSADVSVEGKEIRAGKYGLHMIPSEKEFVIIFSKVNDVWGSYDYDEANDALRVTVTPTETGHQEWLSYGFEDLASTSVSAYLHWEKKKIAFKIATK